MKNIYLASPFFNDKQRENLDKVYEVLKNHKDIDHIFLPGNFQHQELEFGQGLWKYTVFEQDIANIDNADIVVAIINFSTLGHEIMPDPGTVWEMGYARGTNKPVILVDLESEKTEEMALNLMLDMGAIIHTNLNELKELDFNNLFIKRKNYKAV